MKVIIFMSVLFRAAPLAAPCTTFINTVISKSSFDFFMDRNFDN